MHLTAFTVTLLLLPATALAAPSASFFGLSASLPPTTDLGAPRPILQRRSPMNPLNGGGELVKSIAGFISTMATGCPTRTDPSYKLCHACKQQWEEDKKEQAGHHRRAVGELERRSPRGGRGGGAAKVGKAVVKGGKKGKKRRLDCDGYRF